MVKRVITNSEVIYRRKNNIVSKITCDCLEVYWIEQIIPENKPQDLILRVSNKQDTREETRYLHEPTLTEINETIQNLIEGME